MKRVCQGICCSELVDFRESELARCARETEQDALLKLFRFTWPGYWRMKNGRRSRLVEENEGGGNLLGTGKCCMLVNTALICSFPVWVYS
jgi:hypothetical protein